MDLTDLLNNIADFSKKSKPRSKEDKDKKTFGIVSAFRNGIFLIKKKRKRNKNINS